VNGRVAIVTGASSGIGKATALRLARDFSAVALAARRSGELDDVASQIRSIGAEPLVVALDLAGPDAAKALVDATYKKLGRIDAVVNVAGAVPGVDLFQMTDAQWRDGMELKFHGARRLTLAAWDALKQSKGSVVFISGNSAATPKPEAAAVGVINAAIEALSKAFAERGIADDIQVNAVSPGAVISPRRLSMLQKSAADKNLPLEQVRESFLKQVGIRRFGEVDEIADAIAHLLTPTAHWLTGTVLRVDGGEIKSM
jgi:3-oxoacyl-[acyl-carrier protein] reductase